MTVKAPNPVILKVAHIGSTTTFKGSMTTFKGQQKNLRGRRSVSQHHISIIIIYLYYLDTHTIQNKNGILYNIFKWTKKLKKNIVYFYKNV